MKKFAVILAVLFVAFMYNAYAVNDNTGTHQGTGTFSCTIWEALTIGNGGSNDLGTFVVSGTAYTAGWTDNVMTFAVTGHSGATFYYKITEDEDGTNADIVIDWTTLSSPTQTGNVIEGSETLTGGAFTFTGTVSSLTAVSAGGETFTQTVEVSYNDNL